jgi:hypothetical protein
MADMSGVFTETKSHQTPPSAAPTNLLPMWGTTPDYH